MCYYKECYLTTVSPAKILQFWPQIDGAQSICRMTLAAEIKAPRE